MIIIKRIGIFIINPAVSWIKGCGISSKVFAALFTAAIALVILYEVNIPFFPMPGYFESSLAFIILRLAFLTGTLLPFMIISYNYLEEFPLAPGSSGAKAVNLTAVFFLCWGISTILVRGIQLALDVSTNSSIYTLINFIHPAYFFYLLARSASTIYHLPRNKLMISGIPFVFFYLFFYFEISLIRHFLRGQNAASTISVKPLDSMEMILLVVLYVAPLVFLLFSRIGAALARGTVELKGQEAEIDPQRLSPEEAYREGLKMANIGEIDRAIEYFTRSIDSGKAKPDAWLQRGKLFFNNHSYDKAAHDLETFIDEKGSTFSDEAYTFLIQSYFEMEEWDNVIDVSQEILEKYPSDIAALYFKAEAHDHLGEDLEAIEILEEIEKVWKETPGYRRKPQKDWYDRAMKLLSQKKPL